MGPVTCWSSLRVLETWAIPPQTRALFSVSQHTCASLSLFLSLSLSLSSVTPRADGDGSSLTASLSDAHGEDSPLPITYNEEAEEGGGAQETDADADGSNEAPEQEEEDEEDARQVAGGGGNGDAPLNGGDEEAVEVGDAADGGTDIGGEDGGDKPDEPAEAGEGEGDLLDGGLEPEEVLASLSLEGTKALEGGSYSSLSDGDTTAPATSGDASPSVARSLFGFSGKGGGKGNGPRAKEGLGATAEDAEGGCLEDAPVVPSKEEIKLQSRCD